MLLGTYYYAGIIYQGLFLTMHVCTHACDVLKHPTSQYDNSILTVHVITKLLHH